jgi:hypothetical protein
MELLELFEVEFQKIKEALERELLIPEIFWEMIPAHWRGHRPNSSPDTLSGSS